MYICIYIHIYIFIYHVYLYICIRICISTYVSVYINIYTYVHTYIFTDPRAQAHFVSFPRPPPVHMCVLCFLAFTRYCHCQYCIVYGNHKGGWAGGRILRMCRAIVLQWCEQCRWRGQYKDDGRVQESFVE